MHSLFTRPVSGPAAAAPPKLDPLLSPLLSLGFEQSPIPLTLADPNRPDCPLIHVNAAFTRLTGYHAHEAVGRNCRFLQGPRTDPQATAMVSSIAQARREGRVELLNYRKDGTPFWNGLQLAPVHDEEGRLVAILGTQSDISDLRAAREANLAAVYRERETTHRIKNAFQVIESMVKLSGRRSGAPALVEKIATRVRAIATAHTTSLAQPDHAAVHVGSVICDVLDAYQGVAGDRIVIEGPAVNVFPGTVSVLAIVLNELATNALAHGSLSRPQGRVAVTWADCSADFGEETEVVLRWVETGGPRTAAPRRTGEGSATVERLLLAAGGRIARGWRPEGLEVLFSLPRER